MKKIHVIVIVFLALMCMMAPAVATTHSFSANDGEDSGYQGMVVMDDDGNLAFTIVAVVNGDYEAAQDTSDDAGAEQQVTEATGQAAFAGSGASTTNGDAASTADLAMGDGSIVTDQGANANDGGAAAGQIDTTVSGVTAVAASTAVDYGQEATSFAAAENGAVEVSVQGANSYGGVETGQVASAEGESVALGASASAGPSEAGSVTIATTVDGEASAEVNQGAEAGFFGAEAEQDATATGDEVLIASGASGLSSASAVTEVTGAVGAVVVQGQEAEVNFFEAEAEQDFVSATGDEITIAAFAEKNEMTASTVTEVTNGQATVTWQDAEADTSFFDYGAEADQHVTASGEEVFLETTAGYEDYSSATATATVTNGAVASEQNAGWFFGAGADQATMVIDADEAEVTTTATNGGDTAGTTAGGTNVFSMEALQYADATFGLGAEAGEAAYVISEAGYGTGHAATWASAADENEAATWIYYDGFNGVLDTQQYAAADGDAYAYQGDMYLTQDGWDSTSFVAIQNGRAEAGSAATSNEGDEASTEATIRGTGMIFTEQGAAAGDAVDMPLYAADGAAAGQFSNIVLNEGRASAESESESEGWFFLEDNEAGTEASIRGEGEILTLQGAAAGDVFSPVFGAMANGAVAAQWSDLESTQGGEAESWSSNGWENSAETEAGYHGDGGIENTYQGAAAGSVFVFGEGSAEGAIAIQHTDAIWSDVQNGPTAWASSEAHNGRENSAGTEAYAIGDGRIEETTQGAIAGEGQIYGFFGVEVEGAAAGQFTEVIESEVGGGAETWARNGRENFATTEAGFRGDGSIEDTLQVGGAGEIEVRHLGEVEGAIAVQHTDGIYSGDDDTAWASSYARNGRENEAGTRTFALGEDGFIEETTQGAVAGEGSTWLFGLEVEGAAAGQFTERIESDVGGGAVTWAERDPGRRADEQSAETKAMFFGEGGYIEDTLQVAGAGEVESWFFDIEGAGAGQHTDVVNIDDGIAFTESEASTGDRRDVTSAETGNRVLGDGQILETSQGAVVGEFETFFVDGEGAAAGQFTEGVTNGDPDGSASAWTRANNGRERAGTEVEFDGSGIIDDTLQVGGAGEIEGWFFDLEGAGAFQETNYVSSVEGGEAKSWAVNGREDRANTRAYYNGAGNIDYTIQGAGAGEIEVGQSEVEGALAMQYTDAINVLVPTTGSGGAESHAVHNARGWFAQDATADSEVYLGGAGSVTGLYQGAAAGEIDLEDFLDVNAEGAAAGQHFDSLITDGNLPGPDGYTASYARTQASTTESFFMWSSTDSAAVQADVHEYDVPAGFYGVTQIAAGGDFAMYQPAQFWAEGAAAVQGVDSSVSATGIWSESSYDDGAQTANSGPNIVPGTDWAAAGELNGFATSGATAGYLPFNIF